MTTLNSNFGKIKDWPREGRNEPKYPIGTQFKSRGKFPRTCTVIDILKTYNHAGELVEIQYVATHDFMGQSIKDKYVETSIALGRQGMELQS